MTNCLKTFLFSVFSIFLVNNCKAAVGDSANMDSISIQKKFPKNAIRVEGLARSLYIGVLYDRTLVHKKLSLHGTIGIGNLWPRMQLNAYEVSLYSTIPKYKFSPLLGIFHTGVSLTLLFPQRNPSDRFPTASLPKYRFFNGVLLGANWNLSKRFDLQVLYTPFLAFEEGNGLKDFYFAYYWAGLNVGYKF